MTNLQSYYAAKAAIQHTLLKCELMPTQLYDAASFAAGRNPFFDFGQYSKQPNNKVFKSYQINNNYIKLAGDANPGPRFLTNKLRNNSSNIYYWSEVNEDKSEQEFEFKSHRYDYLDKYKADLCFDSANFSEASYPYPFKYTIRDFSVLAIQNQRKYNEEAIKVTVEGSYEDSQGKNQIATLTTIVRIKRKN